MRSVCTILLLFLLTTTGNAAVIVQHSGATDPATEGWSSSFGAPVTGNPGAEDIGAGGCEPPCAYWRVNDPSTAGGSTGGHSVIPSDAQFKDAGGWSLRARVKRIQATPGVEEAPSYSATFYLRSAADGATREFSARLGVTAAGQLTMEVLGAGVFTLGATADYQLIDIVFDPDRNAADFLVNGNVVVADYAGYSPGGTINSIFWGSGQSSTTAQTFWHEVVFETSPDTDGDGLSNVAERRDHGTDTYVADSDDDGASDGEEITASSDPLNKDSDNDTLLDGFEIRYGLAPNAPGDDAADQESDGLNNYLEQKAGANPLAADTDNDGISDSDEVLVYGSNPNRTDSDNDGLGDADEVMVYNTNPASFDSDADGINDDAELNTHNIDPNSADSDSDGALDGQEIANYNTDPLDPDSDDDGLLDGFEVRYAFDPNQAGEQDDDNDGDTLDNLAEQTAGASPVSTDTDEDGLDDNAELNNHNSNPALPDSDGDGLRDGFEIQYAFAVLTPGDDALDPDSDGLSNLEEQTIGTGPRDNDSDNDGVIDGQEVNIIGSNPLFNDAGKVPQQAVSALMFSAAQQPLFINPPSASRINLIPASLIQKAMAENDYGAGPNTYGKVVNVEGEAPLWAYQEAWDRGWAACKTTRTGSTQYDVPGLGLFDACSNWSYTPSDSLCRDGGSINLEAQSVMCCTYLGGFDAASSYPGCSPLPGSGTASFSLGYVEGLYAGDQIPDTITIPTGLGARPTQAPPPANYTVGAEITTDVSMTADLVISAESQDPGQFNINYVTDAALRSDNSSVTPGETFKVWLDYQPRTNESTMSSTWAAIGFTAGYEITSSAHVSAEYWTINPNKAVNYPNPDFQEHGTFTMLDETRTETGEFIGFTAAASDRIEFRFMHGVDAEAIPDFMKDQTFAITSDIIDFDLPDVNQNALPKVDDAIPPGTALPISIPRCVSTDKSKPCPAAPCPFGFAIKGFCFGLGQAASFFKNFFTVGVSQEVVNLRFQLPEVNTPVSDAFWGGYTGDITDLFNGNVQQINAPRRSAIEADGSLVNTVPNGARPLTNYTDTNPLEALFFDTTLLSSDTMRFQWDIDGTFSTAGQVGWFDKSYGNSFLSLTAGVFDVDAAVWTGIDQTLIFKPGLVADISFSQPVMVRLVSDDPALHEVAPSLINPGEVKSLPANIVAKLSTPSVNPTTWLEVSQPVGGVQITASYSFRNNSFANDTRRIITIAPTLTILKAGIHGLVGGLLTAALGSSEIHGPRVTLPTPAVDKVVLGDRFNSEGEVVDDQGNVIGARNVPGQVNILSGVQTLTVVERGSDTDGDGIPDSVEQASCTNTLDLDSDDDGVGDGIEDINRNGVVDAGETNPCNADSDGDGIQDGTEKGAMVGIADPDGNGPLLGTDLRVFVPDPEPTTRTDPTEVNDVNNGPGRGGSGGGGGSIDPVLIFILALWLMFLLYRQTRRFR
ncbi:MAG: hypothetical protein L0Z73_01660 [Gammaproteobacteria bacterium]|nr:hypothetical protein [Gammaproteobacteria bacterium]